MNAFVAVIWSDQPDPLYIGPFETWEQAHAFASASVWAKRGKARVDACALQPPRSDMLHVQPRHRWGGVTEPARPQRCPVCGGPFRGLPWTFTRDTGALTHFCSRECRDAREAREAHP